MEVGHRQPAARYQATVELNLNAVNLNFKRCFQCWGLNPGPQVCQAGAEPLGYPSRDSDLETKQSLGAGGQQEPCSSEDGGAVK